jgi:hypothetical protein
MREMIIKLAQNNPPSSETKKRNIPNRIRKIYPQKTQKKKSEINEPKSEINGCKMDPKYHTLNPKVSKSLQIMWARPGSKGRTTKKGVSTKKPQKSEIKGPKKRNQWTHL